MIDRRVSSEENKKEKLSTVEVLTSQRQQKAYDAASHFTSKFAEIVKIRREELGLRQEDLVLALQSCGLQVSQGYISLLEASQRQKPNVQLMVAIAVLLDISLDELLSRSYGERENG